MNDDIFTTMANTAGGWTVGGSTDFIDFLKKITEERGRCSICNKEHDLMLEGNYYCKEHPKFLKLKHPV